MTTTGPTCEICLGLALKIMFSLTSFYAMGGAIMTLQCKYHGMVTVGLDSNNNFTTPQHLQPDLSRRFVEWLGSD